MNKDTKIIIEVMTNDELFTYLFNLIKKYGACNYSIGVASCEDDGVKETECHRRAYNYQIQILDLLDELISFRK